MQRNKDVFKEDGSLDVTQMQDACLAVCYAEQPKCGERLVGTRRAGWFCRSESELTNVFSLKYSLRQGVCQPSAFDMLL